MNSKQKKTTFDWTTEKTRLLIEFIQKNEFLYNCKDELYKDKEKREIKFRDISEIIGCSVYEAKDKWQKLRTYYNKEHTKAKCKKSGMGTGQIYTPKWEYYTSMTFLSSSLEPAPSTSTLDFMADGKVYSIHEAEETFVHEIVEESEDEAVVPMNTPPPKKKKIDHSRPRKSESSSTQKKNELIENCINLLKTPAPQNDKPQNPDELFGIHLAHTMAPLSPKSKDFVKIKIMEVVFQHLYKDSTKD